MSQFKISRIRSVLSPYKTGLTQSFVNFGRSLTLLADGRSLIIMHWKCGFSRNWKCRVRNSNNSTSKLTIWNKMLVFTFEIIQKRHNEHPKTERTIENMENSNEKKKISKTNTKYRFKSKIVCRLINWSCVYILMHFIHCHQTILILGCWKQQFSKFQKQDNNNRTILYWYVRSIEYYRSPHNVDKCNKIRCGRSLDAMQNGNRVARREPSPA